MKKKIYIFYIFLIPCSFFLIKAQGIYTEAGSTVYVSDATVVDGAVSTTPTIYAEGAIQNGGTLLNQGEIQLKGNLSNTGNFNSAGDEVFLGTAAQTVSGNLTNANAFSHLIVDKASNSLTLIANAEASTQVNLVNGKVVLGTNNLSLGATATMTGYDANDYIMTNSTGRLKQTVNATTKVFPVGNSNYNPVSMSNVGTSDVFAMRVVDAVTGPGGAALNIDNKVNRTWDIQEATVGGSNATITTQWNTANQGGTFSNSSNGIANYDGTSFNLPAANAASTTVSAGVYSQTQTGQTMISPRIVTSVGTVTATGNTTFCDGGSVLLTSPTNAVYTYQWYKNGVAIAGANTSSYTANASGDYNVAITVSGTCIMKTAPITVTELAYPTAVITPSGPLTFCENTPTTLYATAGAGYTYTWMQGGNIMQTGASNAYVPNQNGSHTVIVTNSIGCSSTSANVVIHIKNIPTADAGPDQSVCPGSGVQIGDHGSGGNTYSWSPATYLSNANIDEPVSTPLVNTIYTLTVTKNSTGCSDTDEVLVSLKQAEIPTITSTPAAVGSTITVCSGGASSGSATLTGNSTQASPSYSWKLAGNLIAGANASSYVANVTTSNNNKVFSVQATYANGCVRTSANRTVHLETTCVPKTGTDKDGDELILIGEEASLNAYPNPTKGNLTVEISNSLVSEGDLSLYNALGQMIMEKKVIMANGNASEVLDLRTIAIGVYTLTFQTSNGQIVQKVVKE